MGSASVHDSPARPLPPTLILNAGSSSIKFALFAGADGTSRTLSGKLDRIGLPTGTLDVRPAAGEPIHRDIAAPTLTAAVDLLLAELARHTPLAGLGAIGHRIVHGGPRYAAPAVVTPAVLADLKALVPLAPDHLPLEIALIEALARHAPAVAQVACFDTAFHHHLPRVAQLLPLPQEYLDRGVRRFGFHGLSYSYLLEELSRLDADAARGRVVFAHLGNGASLAAVRDGQCLDTSMGFTPAAGLVMGTRSGDLDPGLMRYLAHAHGVTADQFDDLVNHRAGLLGVSGRTYDMRELLASRATDPWAADAVALFCYQLRKWIGAFAAVLGGLDALVFSGGIGERAAEVRAEVCTHLAYLGLILDAPANAAHAHLISSPASRVQVRVIPTDEERMMARLVARVCGSASPAPPQPS